MTISQCLVQWLYNFGNISIDDRIETDALASAADSMGIYKTPRTNYRNYVDGSRDVTAYYNFLVRQSGQSEAERQSGQTWMETLEDWVRANCLAGDVPQLGDGRTCNSIAVSSSFYMSLDDGEENVYQVTLEINYTEEKRVIQHG